MRRILKNEEGIPILNFFDLKKHFQPRVLYNNLELFQSFAKTHCVYITAQLQSGITKEKYIAKYLTKDFWNMLLSEQELNVECNNDTAIDVFLRYVFRKYKKNESEIVSPPTEHTQELSDNNELADEDELTDADDMISVASREIDTQKVNDEIKEELTREIKDADIERELTWLMDSNDKTISVATYLKLLAIAFLCEVPPSQTDPALWRINNIQGAPKETEVEIKRVLETAKLSLMPGSTVYRYWYHDSDLLSEGQNIRTVKVEAQIGSNRHAEVQIELYSFSTGECIQRFTLMGGEYRYCNVSEGKVIKFLPNAAVSDNLCVMRKDLSHSVLSFITENTESFLLDGVTSFAAGSREKGCIILKNGKVQDGFYHYEGNERNRKHDLLNMIAVPVVEVEIGNEGYRILLNNGIVVNENGETEKKGVVSLCNNGRGNLPEINGESSREVVLSTSRKSLAVLPAKNQKEHIFFHGNGKIFTLSEANGKLIVYLK